MLTAAWLKRWRDRDCRQKSRGSPSLRSPAGWAMLGKSPKMRHPMANRLRNWLRHLRSWALAKRATGWELPGPDHPGSSLPGLLLAAIPPHASNSLHKSRLLSFSWLGSISLQPLWDHDPCTCTHSDLSISRPPITSTILFARAV